VDVDDLLRGLGGGGDGRGTQEVSAGHLGLHDSNTKARTLH
jgi:hypothetical protein